MELITSHSSESQPERRPVSILLDADLLARAQALSPDLSLLPVLSLLIERLLRAHSARLEQAQGDQNLAGVLSALDAFHAEHGFMSDEFPSL